MASAARCGSSDIERSVFRTLSQEMSGARFDKFFFAPIHLHSANQQLHYAQHYLCCFFRPVVAYIITHNYMHVLDTFINYKIVSIYE